jgi:uncharacterized protein YoxC
MLNQKATGTMAGGKHSVKFMASIWPTRSEYQQNFEICYMRYINFQRKLNETKPIVPAKTRTGNAGSNRYRATVRNQANQLEKAKRSSMMFLFFGLTPIELLIIAILIAIFFLTIKNTSTMGELKASLDSDIADIKGSLDNIEGDLDRLLTPDPELLTKEELVDIVNQVKQLRARTKGVADKVPDPVVVETETTSETTTEGTVVEETAQEEPAS